MGHKFYLHVKGLLEAIHELSRAVASAMSKHQKALESLIPLIQQAWGGPGICMLAATTAILRPESLECTWRSPPLEAPTKNHGRQDTA